MSECERFARAEFRLNTPWAQRKRASRLPEKKKRADTDNDLGDIHDVEPAQLDEIPLRISAISQSDNTFDGVIHVRTEDINRRASWYERQAPWMKRQRTRRYEGFY